METIFSLSTLVVAPFWLLMIVLPQWRWTSRLLELPIAEALLGLVYIGLAATVLPDFIATFSSPSLSAVAAFLATPAGVTIGWVHFLAFDLFVGRWIYRDSRARGTSALLVALPLLLVFLAGPTGLVLYLALRAAGGRTVRSATAIEQGGPL